MPVHVLLISTYELGHQPLHVASPAAELRAAGHRVSAVDIAVDTWDPALTDDVDRVAISVPMHTAMRLAIEVAHSIRDRRPTVPICLYGLYATVATDTLVPSVVDAMIAGEYERALVDWIDGAPGRALVDLARRPRRVPARDVLAPLDRYARLLGGDGMGGERSGDDGDGGALVAAVQTSHGCASRCRHCPVPAVYDGRIRIVAPDIVAADIDQAIALGAAHLTFADPDFLNGPHHAMRVVRDLHQRHPHVTFDITTKIELILAHADLWSEMAASGCLFVTTALECVDDAILALLDKGHTAADAARAVMLLRHHGISVRPSLLTFTPWTTLDGVADLAIFAIEHDLAEAIDPVHWTIRLLVPDGSLLLQRPELAPYVDGYDPENLGWHWHPSDPRTDQLQRRLAVLVEEADQADQEPGAVFEAIVGAIEDASGRRLPARGPGAGPGPRLSEAWFCCAEPTCGQRLQVASEPPVGPTTNRWPDPSMEDLVTTSTTELEVDP